MAHANGHAQNGAVEQGQYVPTAILITGGAGFIGCHVVRRLVTTYPQYKVRISLLFRRWRSQAAVSPATGRAGPLSGHQACQKDVPRPAAGPDQKALCAAQVVCLDKMDYVASLNNLADIADRPNFKVGSLLRWLLRHCMHRARVLSRGCVQFIKGDIQSGDLLRYVMDTEGIDTVMHFAAQVGRFHTAAGLTDFWFDSAWLLQTHVDNSFGNSLAFTMNNTFGTHMLLEACRMSPKIRRVVNVSTDEVYGESSLGAEAGVGSASHQPHCCLTAALRGLLRNPLAAARCRLLTRPLRAGLKENSTLEPTNPYSAAKAGAEMMAKAYFTSYKLPIVITRGNNVYALSRFVCVISLQGACLRCLSHRHLASSEAGLYTGMAPGSSQRSSSQSSPSSPAGGRCCQSTATVSACSSAASFVAGPSSGCLNLL